MVVEYELADSVARIYLNRPHRLNAVVPELTAGLARYCRERLAAFEVPRFWQPASDLPRTGLHPAHLVSPGGVAGLPGPAPFMSAVSLRR